MMPCLNVANSRKEPIRFEGHLNAVGQFGSLEHEHDVIAVCDESFSPLAMFSGSDLVPIKYLPMMDAFLVRQLTYTRTWA